MIYQQQLQQQQAAMLQQFIQQQSQSGNPVSWPNAQLQQQFMQQLQRAGALGGATNPLGTAVTGEASGAAGESTDAQLGLNGQRSVDV